MSEKLTISGINRKPKTSKGGKNYESLGLLFSEKPTNQWVNGFGDKNNQHWKKGQVLEVNIDIELTEQPDGKGGVYYNFKTLKGGTGNNGGGVPPALALEIANIKKRLDALEGGVKQVTGPATTYEPNIDGSLPPKEMSMEDELRELGENTDVPF